MFANLITLTSLVAIAAALPGTHEQRNVHHNVPAPFSRREYAQDAAILEPYAVYHERYEAFACKTKHNSSFFDQCCHPMLKTQKEDDLPDSCFACDDEPVASSSVVAKPVATSKAPNKIATSIIQKPTTVKHEPSSTHKASSPATSAASSGGSSGGSSGTMNKGGQATYFLQGGNAGACGTKHDDMDLIVAIDIARYGNTSQKSSLCGKKVKIVNTNNNKSVVATIADVCPTCTPGDNGKGDAKNSIDLSKGTFLAIEPDLGVGAFDIEWSFV